MMDTKWRPSWHAQNMRCTHGLHTSGPACSLGSPQSEATGPLLRHNNPKEDQLDMVLNGVHEQARFSQNYRWLLRLDGNYSDNTEAQCFCQYTRQNSQRHSV